MGALQELRELSRLEELVSIASVPLLFDTADESPIGVLRPTFKTMQCVPSYTAQSLLPPNRGNRQEHQGLTHLASVLGAAPAQQASAPVTISTCPIPTSFPKLSGT